MFTELHPRHGLQDGEEAAVKAQVKARLRNHADNVGHDGTCCVLRRVTSSCVVLRRV